MLPFRWEVALPPYLYLPIYQAAAAAMDTQALAAQQQQQQQYMADSLQQHQRQYEQQQVLQGLDPLQQQQGSRMYGPAQGSGMGGLNPDPMGVMQGPLMHDGNLAPLQETAENASSRCTSEMDPDQQNHSNHQGQQHLQTHAEHDAAAADADGENQVQGTFPMIRSASAQSQQYQERQQQQQQQQPSYIDPSGWRVPSSAVQLQLQLQAGLLPANAAGYRRASYMSDTSCHPRRSSNASQFSTDTSSQVGCGVG
jgi:hypothetical protein